MNKMPEFTYDEINGIASCTIKYKNMTFGGFAECHPDDRDFMARATGENIAAMRATIEYLIFVRDCEIKPALNALKHLKACMIHSKNYNPKSYEAKSLNRQIDNYENDLAEIKAMIAKEKINLKLYITQKDAYYRLVRERRKKAESN